MSREDWNRPEEFGVKKGYKRIGIEVSYNGSDYYGWQMQRGLPSVQGELKSAVSKLTSCEDVTICGSGRTDSGVHALGQVAHIDLPESVNIPVEAFNKGLNAYLPKDIRIRRSFSVSESFHARFSTMSREYRYFISCNDSSNPLMSNYVYYLKNKLDLELLNSYASAIFGTHDFTTFGSSQDLSESKVRDIYSSEFFYTKSIFGDDIICYRICGNAFLHHMIRSLVGTMLELEREKASVLEFKKILESKERALCKTTAPAHALFLWRISYDPDEFMWFEEKVK